MTIRSASRVLDAATIARALDDVAQGIAQRVGPGERMALVGIRTRGVPLAARLADRLQAARRRRPPTGSLDINLYRDDLSLIADHPVLRKTEIPFEVDGADIVLVDDVLFTGRTIRAALDALIDLGRPERIRLAVLIDRGHRELPIQPDFVGCTLETERDELVEVRLTEIDGVAEDSVVLRRRDGGRGRRGEDAGR